MTGIYRAKDTYKILARLSVNGWVPLSNLATLLGYAHPSTLFRRQRNTNTESRIPTIRVGGQNRVYEDTVIDLLNNSKNETYTKTILTLYRRIKPKTLTPEEELTDE